MIRYFTEHPTASNLVMVLLIIAGLLTLPTIKRETFPDVNSYEVEINVVYPGASPNDVEQSICKPLEDALDGISFMEEKRCQARDSQGLMTVKMVERGNFTEFLDDIKSAVDGIDNFPEKAEMPVVKELGRTGKVITVALTADLPRQELKTLAEQLKQKMLALPNIPLVEIKGFSTRQLQIQVPQENLRQYGISIQDIANLVAQQNVDLPAGDVTTEYRDYQVRFSDEKRSIEELSELTVIQGLQHNEIKLSDIATITSGFDKTEDKISYQGKPAAFLEITKNTLDDSLNVLDAVNAFVTKEGALLPKGVELRLTQDHTTPIKDRLSMLGTNAWQGLLLVFAVMWLFFNVRYAFWVVMGLPVSFLASAFVLAQLGISINMISMVALLLALGILMDDAIVISESIGSEIKRGKSPLDAAIDGTKRVSRGVFSSFLTTLCVFSGLLFLSGDIGQILKIIPVVLISVITVSLLEAFFILPSHLHHSLAHAKRKGPSNFRLRFDQGFDNVRLKVDDLVTILIRYRYAFVGSVIALLVISVSMMPAGILKVSPFPSTEGNLLEARILLPSGTSMKKTEEVVNKVVLALNETNDIMSKKQGGPVIESTAVNFNQNSDAFEKGAHLATVNVDMLAAEYRNFSLNEFIRLWRENAGDFPEALSLTVKEPAFGPAGRAIQIRLKGDDLNELSLASSELQQWLSGYPGVSNLFDDLRPGKPEFTLHLKPGAFALGLNAQTIAGQLRAAYQGSKVAESTVGLEIYEVVVSLDDASKDELADFDNFPIIHPLDGSIVPLSHVADIMPTRGFSRIHRINNRRTVSVFGDIDGELNNTGAVMADLKRQYLKNAQERFPDIQFLLEGEVKEGAETQGSMNTAFLLGLAGVFILLSFQFRSYAEPIIVMLNIPLAFIGVVWGHLIMGFDITMPSMVGFVSLAGIVVNDSILLVEFVKMRVKEGFSVHEAAAKASHDRFRAVLLTSLTTIAGLTPLLFESSLQAQILIPLATSIVFGIGSSTLLVLFVIPCMYSILEDFGLANVAKVAKGLESS